MTILTVGAGKTFEHISDAVAASHDGDVIQVQAGTYVNDFATINTKITIESVGGLARLVATASPPDGKAIFTTNTDLTIDGLSFAGAQVGDGNGAGIRYQNGYLVVKNSFFYDNQDGILGGPAVAGTGSVTITNSEFSHNGSGDGYTHNVYIGDVGSLTIDNSYFHDAVVGHEIKSRAESTTITNSRIQDGPNGTASYSIDLPNGGTTLIQNNTIEQGPNSQNPSIIAYGEEGSLHANSTLTVKNNTILNDLNNGNTVAVWNAGNNTAVVANNTVYGLSNGQVARGSATVTGTTFTKTEPPLVTTSPWMTTGTATLATDTIVLHMSEDAWQGDAQFSVDVNGLPVEGVFTATTLHSSGQSQAFTLTGAWGAGPLVVGVTFLNDGFGNGGDRNLYVNSIDLNGTANPAAAASLYSPGTAALIVSGPATATAPTAPTTTDTISLLLSEDAYNGDALFTATIDGVSLGSAQAVTALHSQGKTQAFTFAGSYGSGPHTVAVSFINDAYGGSGMDRNLYVSSVSMDGMASATSNVSLLSNGSASFQVAGAATPIVVAPTPTPAASDTLVLNLSENAWNGDAQFTVSVDGKQVAAAQAVTADHSKGKTQAFTITGAYGAGAHTVGVTFTNDAYGGSGMDRNLYVDSVVFDGTANASGKATLFSNGTANFAVSSNTAPITPDTLTLNLSEDSYLGDAQFIVTVDGKSLGSAQSVTALHSAGKSQAFNFSSVLGAGPHDVAVTFTNDLYTPGSGDRNLYVASMDMDGTHYASATANMYSGGTVHFTIGTPSS